MNDIRPRIMIVHSTGLSMDKIDEIKEAAPNADYIIVEDTREAIFDEIAGVHALAGCPRPIFSDELVEKAGDQLKWVHVGGAGCEHFIIPSMINSNIVLTNGKIIQGPEVSDHAMALALALTRNIGLVIRGETKDMPRPIELRGKTAVVIAQGGIGALIAEKANAFGMKVYAVNPDYFPMMSFYEDVVSPEEMMEVLPLADLVFMAAAFTEKSKKMIGAEQFAVMKPTAYFINVSRGETVCTDSLLSALNEGRLKGAGLDVSDPEPLPVDHPLRSMKNVIITPHIAGPSDFNRERAFELLKKNVQKFVAGLPLLNVVNKSLGY